jgi:polyhydroxyalkanoate synthesis regulator phasin
MKQEGLLVGYPDGLFRGGRPASRYELAVAIHAVWTNLKGQIDSLNGQISDLQQKIANAPTKADLDALRDAISALQNQTKANTDDIAALRRMVDEFSAELKRMGADIDQMKKDLAEMGRKVDWLWGHRLPFDVSGDLNIVGLGGYSSDDEFGITVDGRPTGIGRGSTSGVPQGATRDLTILHEAALTLTSNEAHSEGSAPRFRATFALGNMLGAGSQSFGLRQRNGLGQPVPRLPRRSVRGG